MTPVNTRPATMPVAGFIALLSLLLVAIGTAAADEWTSRAFNMLTDGDEVAEESEVKLVGKLVERDDKDDKGDPISRAFLEQDDGELIPLPCERKQGDAGLGKKAAGKATAGLRNSKDSCWDFLGEEVQVLGTAQSITKKTKRYRRLMNITGISLL